MATRNEAVRLTLQDDFTSGMARAAAATALLSRELKGLSGQSVVSARTSQTIARDTDNIAKSANTADRSINQLTGRLRLFADVAAILGPGLIPIGAVGIPAIAGLANQLGVAALAGGSAIIAFQGVGDALKAVNEAAIEPTAENLEAARLAMANLSPAAQDMVSRLQELRPVMTGIRDTAAEGLFPGVLEMFDSLETRVPEVERIIGNISASLGDLASGAGESFASDRWTEFFDYLATDAPATLTSFGRTVGDLTHGMAELWMAFDPLNDDFSGWLEDVASGFDDWASGLSETQGFREFIDYIRDTGPQVAETFGALGNAVVQIVQAAAPLGGPILNALEGVFDVIARIADSDLGTPIFAGVAALAAFNRTMAITVGLTKGFGATATAANFRTLTSGVDRARTSLGGLRGDLGVMASTYMTAGARSERAALRLASSTERVKSAAAGLGKGAAGVGALALATSGLADDFALSNTAMLGMLGTVAGPWGAAIGASIGLIMDFSGGHEVSQESVSALTATLNEQTGALTENSREWAASRLQEMGGFEAAKTLGLELDTVTQAALGNSEAMREVQAAMDDVQGAQDPNSGVTAEGIIKARAAAESLGEILGITGSEVDEARSKVRDFAEATGRAGDASRGAGDGIMSLGEAMEASAAAGTALVESLKRVSDALAGRASVRDYEQALDDYSAALKKAKDDGADFLNAQRTGFDTNKQSGRELEAALDNIASTAVDVASKLKGTERVRVLTRARDDIRRAALDARLTREAVRELIMETYNLDGLKAKAEVAAETEKAEAALRRVTEQLKKYGLTVETAQAALHDVASGKIKTVQGLIDKYGMTRAQARALLDDQASGKINGVRANLQNLNGDTANTYINTYVTTIRRTKYSTGPGSGPGLQQGIANGAVMVNGVKKFADGGWGKDGQYYERVPQVVKGGANILWAEEETGYEAYISRKKGMEARNIAVLNEAASWWGLSLTKRYANGGATTPTSVVVPAAPPPPPAKIDRADMEMLAQLVAEYNYEAGVASAAAVAGHQRMLAGVRR